MRDKSRIISGAKPLWIEPVQTAQLVRNARMHLSQGNWFWRESGAGSQVVACLHGLQQDSSQWQALLEYLGQSCHCVAPDLPGVGESARSRVDSLAGLIAGVDEWLDALRIDRLWLAGCDLGAWLAISYALQRPQRVLGIVLMAPEAVLTLPAPRRAWPWMPTRRPSPQSGNGGYPLLVRAQRSTRSTQQSPLAAVQSDILQMESWSDLACPVWTLRSATDATQGQPRLNGPHADWLANTRQAFVPVEGDQWLQDAPAAVAAVIERMIANPRSPLLQLD